MCAYKEPLERIHTSPGIGWSPRTHNLSQSGWGLVFFVCTSDFKDYLLSDMGEHSFHSLNSFPKQVSIIRLLQYYFHLLTSSTFPSWSASAQIGTSLSPAYTVVSMVAWGRLVTAAATSLKGNMIRACCCRKKAPYLRRDPSRVLQVRMRGGSKLGMVTNSYTRWTNLMWSSFGKCKPHTLI